MAIANYVKTCSKNIPGNQKQFFIAPAGTVTAVAETANKISTLTAAADSFKRVQADIDTVQVTSDGTYATAGGSTQSLIAKFSMPSTALNIWLAEIRNAIACGLEIIHVDANGKVWLSGVTVETKEGNSRPWNSFQQQLDTGLLMTDEGMQAVTATFSRLSGFHFTELDTTLSASVLDGTAAQIDW
jgi:hypothetical protein